MLNISVLTLGNGKGLINVPCDEQVLIDLGFSAADAHMRCNQAKLDADWAQIRTYRNSLLAACDYTQFPDAPFSAEQRTAWADYRQQLRDITANFVTPDEIVWPMKPE